IAGTPWAPGGSGSWREQGVVILLAGNSSRSEYVESALAQALGVPDLKVWSPGASTPMHGVVRYETPPRAEGGAEILGGTPEATGRLYACAVSPTHVGIRVVTPDERVVRTVLNLALYLT